MASGLLERIANGRTDLVKEWLENGEEATARDPDGVHLASWCAYYGDVTALKLLLDRGETLEVLGDNLGLRGAAFHGHWKLCEFLLESGADVNAAAADTGETALHSALCTPNRVAHDAVVRVLLAFGGDPDRATKTGVETDAFMRDSRTKGETALHRAAVFGAEETIDLLLAAGASRTARDANGDTPLSWASWAARPDGILRRLLYGGFSIHPERRSMEANLQGVPRGGPPGGGR
jgi:ankyrin repeat protein